MKIEKLRLLYFSPTQTTKKILNAIAAGFKAEAVIDIDLTPPDSIRPNESGKEIRINDGLTVIGVPVYTGRVAPEAARRIRQFKANGTPAVLVVLYGNREFEDALKELRDLAVQAGFRPMHCLLRLCEKLPYRRPRHEGPQDPGHRRMVVEKLQQTKGAGDVLPNEPDNSFPFWRRAPANWRRSWINDRICPAIKILN
jgi:hypothetical protein